MVHWVKAACPHECSQCVVMLQCRCETSIFTHNQYCAEIILHGKFDASNSVWSIFADHLFLLTSFPFFSKSLVKTKIWHFYPIVKILFFFFLPPPRLLFPYIRSMILTQVKLDSRMVTETWLSPVWERPFSKKYFPFFFFNLCVQHIDKGHVSSSLNVWIIYV